MLRTPFWQRAAQALPPGVRGRHAKHLERAERIESVVGATVELWRRIGRSLGAHTHG
jgi:hypothetical protein